MSGSGQAPRNGLAKVLSEADPDTAPEDLIAERDEYQCPSCGWTSELRRNQCLVCEYDQELRPAQAGVAGDA